MGKKSKKKGGGAASKAARKEKLQERREQQLEQLDQNSDDGGGGGNNEIVQKRPDREYFVGDRVWFFRGDDPYFDRENPNTYRGIVKAVNGEDVVIMSLQTLIDGADYTHTINSTAKPTDGKFVFPDFRGMTLRFDVGEKVICRSYGGSWDPATVTSFWPIFHIEEFDPPAAAADYIPHYKCDLLLEGGFATPPSDSDGCVQKRPTSFRFKVGDNVTFNSMKADGDTQAAENYLQRTGGWTDGKITLVDVCEENLSYAVYKCTFKVATKKYSCFIYDDYDENIALVDADPRKRLFDAIEQDCSRYHFIYLQTHFNIDIDAFRDLVMSKAIQFASYNALTWLQRDCNIDARLVKDKHGNNFLHMIANSPYASRFIRRLGENGYLQENTDDVKLALIDHGRVRTTEKNNDGEIWLQSLVRRGDVKALDTALSPHCGLAWDSYFIRGEVIGLLAASIKESKNRMMQCILDEVVSFHTIFEQLEALQFINAKSDDELLQDDRLSVFRGGGAKRGAKLFTRFYRDRQERLSQNLMFKRIFRTLVEHGMFRLFQLLYEEDQGLFETDDYTNAPNEDRQQFIQEELRTDKDNGPTSLVTNMFNACVLGSHSVYLYSKDFQNYARIVKSHFLMCDEDECPSLCHHLSIEKERISRHEFPSSWKDLVEYRLRLLEDEADVKGRQDILDYLLLKNDHVRLDPLFILQHRQCWALRFIVEKGHLDLEGLATKEENLAQNASTLTFLSSGRIPPNMTVRCCLSFAAVQYDDLQSLEWLSKPLGAPSDVVDGWNLLHYSAFMGRIEIIGWLSTQPVWKSLISHASTRKSFSGAYAVHIAASCGHLHACDLMIDLKVPLEDKKGKLPEDYAKKSRHEFVRKWAASKAKPQALKKHVTKLLRQVEEQKSVSQIKDFIISSKCLDMDKWRSCGIRNSQETLLGISFQEVLHGCCKCSDIELVRWVCLRLYYCCSNHDYFAEAFWGDCGKKLLSRNDIVSFARERGYDDLVGRLQGKWLKDVSCNDPLVRNPVLKSALGGDERLVDVRAVALRIDALVNVAQTTREAIEDILLKGGRVVDLEEVFKINAATREAVETETSDLFPSNDERRRIYELNDSGSFEMIQCLDQYDSNLSVSLPLLYDEETGRTGNEVHIFLATEGYKDLLHFCLSNVKGWTAAMELNVIRIASFFGHTSSVEMLLDPRNTVVLRSDKNERYIAAILGAGQALRYRELESLMTVPTGAKGVGRDKGTRIEGESFKGYFQSDSDSDIGGIHLPMMNKSLLVAVLTGYARETFDTDEDNRATLKTLRLLVDKNMYSHDEILYAMELLLFRDGRIIVYELRYLDLLQRVVDAFCITLVSHSKQIQKICELVIRYAKYIDTPTSEVLDDIASFFSKMAKAGIDIQKIGEDLQFYSGKVDFKWLADLQQKQIDDWSRFDIVKKGGSLADIQEAMKDRGLAADSRDRGGLLLIHLSAAYDHVDLLEWLVVKEGMDLDARDAQNRTTLDVAKASKASSATKWIVEWKAKATIGSFLRRNYYQAMYRRRMQQSNDAATRIQSVVRAYATRKIFANVLLRRMEESQRFTAVWGRVIASVDKVASSTSWADIREQLIDIKVGLDDEMLDDTDQKLSTAMEEAVQDESPGEDNDFAAQDIDDSETLVPDSEEAEELTNSNSQWLSFQMTSHVVKFLQQGDKKYRSFFVRRMRQLASGERSRILQKPLKGSKTLIFETYLEQKSGHRILWTEESGSIVIWYIARHKQVNRLMQLIDDSKSRIARQQIPAALVSELQNEGLLNQDEPKKEVLIDIFGNTPLKIYDVNFNAINEITNDSWSPRLHLTDEERDIVEADGTVLVLGRSGTGKTICICSSIEFDRQSGAARDPLFTQLFVARSVRLCRYVEGAVGEDNRTSFLTYGRLLNDIESTLGQTRNFNPSQRIDFGRFKRDFHNCSSSNENISALISWTVIRTFLKGSVEAFQSPGGILPRDEFVEVERLGKNRCRIPAELREQIYDEFLQYQKYLEDQQLWDDCDRVRHLLLCINRAKKEDPEAFDQVKRSKVYVDEVQDYTQLEILLFFYLSGPNGLFLAGDPAQSVVEGTEFRFDEVRGVGHFVGSVIQKPKTVNVNFRSHSGILNCAGGVLDILFTHFPSSAKQLKKDEGLFQGSRPGVLSGTSINQLNTLLGDKLKGAVVLTHDDSARHWRRLLNDYKVSIF